MKTLLLLIAVLFGTTATAQELRLLELDEFSMEYAKIENYRDAYFPYADGKTNEPEVWAYSTSAKFDLTIAAYRAVRFRWRNQAQGDATTVQFRQVAWKYRWGLQLGERIEIFYDHVSRHLLDEAPAGPRTYPLENRIGAEIIFYKRK